MNFAVLIVRMRGFVHSAIYDEIAEAVAASLRELGHQADVSEELWPKDRYSIVFNTPLLFAAGNHAPKMPDKYTIVYNFDPLSSSWVRDHLKLFQNAWRLWDFSRASTNGWNDWHGIHAVHVPVGYHSSLKRVVHKKDSDKDIDLLFTGAMTDRRKVILQQIVDMSEERKMAMGKPLNLHFTDRTYGSDRDALIARAKVNLHIDAEPGIPLSIRVPYLCANQALVVAEESEEVRRSFPCVTVAPYDTLAKVAVGRVLASEEERTNGPEGSMMGHSVLMRRPYKEILNKALAESGLVYR